MPDAGHIGETGSDKSNVGAAAAPTPRAAPSLVILGADALLAAQPATAVQLAHACLRVGYHAVVPASWGDELIAGGCLKQLASRRVASAAGGTGGAGGASPAIFCACPYVAHRLLAVGPDLEPFLTSFVAPPVAVARYLRALYEPTRLRLTYVGRCPGAADDTIDARISPDELLAVLAERGVDLAEQPRVFDSVIPPDRRRFLSQPGGLPSADFICRADPERRTAEVTGQELVAELAQYLLSRTDVLIDVAPRLGCACSGAVPGTPPERARAGVIALEPPRAASPVVDDRVPIAIELPLPAASRTPIDVAPSASAQRTSAVSRAVQSPEPTSSPSDATPESGSSLGRRRSPTGGVAVRQPPGGIPTARSGEGRALPRAYVARRGTGARSRGPSTPPRGEVAQRLDASAGRAGGQAANGDARRGAERVAVPTASERAARVEQVERAERVERAELPERGETPFLAPPPSPPAGPTSGEAPVGAAETESRGRTATLWGPPDRTSDPHGEPFYIPAEVTDEAERAAAALRAPAPVSGARATSEESFRTRTAAFARTAVVAARQRRGIVAALLAVALLSASVGVLAGRWLAARRATPAATQER